MELRGRVGHPHLVSCGARGLCALPPSPPAHFASFLSVARRPWFASLLAFLASGGVAPVARLPAWSRACWPESDCLGSSVLGTSALFLFVLIGGFCAALRRRVLPGTDRFCSNVFKAVCTCLGRCRLASSDLFEQLLRLMSCGVHFRPLAVFVCQAAFHPSCCCAW